MINLLFRPLAGVLVGVLLIPGCLEKDSADSSQTPNGNGNDQGEQEKYSLEEVAESEQQWIGVAVSQTGRLFVCYPRWGPNVPVSVAELPAEGGQTPYPNGRWNSWTPDLPPIETPPEMLE